MSVEKSIAIVGAGAVGGYYGAKLARRFDGVRFLLRSDYEVVKQNGLLVESPEGGFCLPEVSAFRTPEEIGPVDLVIVALKTTANQRLGELISPLLKEGTVVLTLQNGLGNEEALAELFPNHPILGGLCFVCINRDSPGVIRHIAHGKVEMGSAEAKHSALAIEVCDLFQQAKIECSVLPDLGLARWRKLVWNIPFNGLAIAAGGIDVSKILADPVLLSRTKRLMAEVIETASAVGFAIPVEFAETNLDWTAGMGAYQPSSLIDFLQHKPVEVGAIWGEPLKRAKAAGVETPELAQLYVEICEQIQ